MNHFRVKRQLHEVPHEKTERNKSSLGSRVWAELSGTTGTISLCRSERTERIHRNLGQESEALKLLMRLAEATTSPKTGRHCRRRKGQRRSLDRREPLGAEGTQQERIEDLDSSERR